jgi:hypothetical protein
MECRGPMTRGLRLSPGWRWPAFACISLAAACAPPPDAATKSPPAGEWRAFEGTWSAAGSRHTLKLEPGHYAAVFHLTGSLLLSGPQRLGVGFRAQVIGISDTLAGMSGRCVWTDEHGDEIYSELKGATVATGGRIEGTILGGTGRYAGVTGEYSFRWQYVVAENDEVSGRVADLKGRARIGPATVTERRSP